MPDILEISDRDAKKYICIILITSTLLFFVVICVNFFAIKSGGTGVTTLDLYKYQIRKLENENEVELVFVGDSSLGHAIDAKHFGELAQKKTLNLALTGSYGLLGSYNMLRHSVSMQPVKTAVIMQSLDIFSEPISHVGYYQTLGGLESAGEVSLDYSTYFDIYFNINIFLGIIKSWRSPDPSGMIAEVIVNDYVLQGPQMHEQSIQAELSEQIWEPETIQKDRYMALKLINNFCNENKIECIFTTSPYFDQACNRGSSYIEEVMNLAANTDIKILSEQICFPVEHIGDSFNHIDTRVKKDYTEIYYNLIEKIK